MNVDTTSSRRIDVNTTSILCHVPAANIKFVSGRTENLRTFKGRVLKFRRYHNFANLFSKLSETTFYTEISMFSKKV